MHTAAHVGPRMVRCKGFTAPPAGEALAKIRLRSPRRKLPRPRSRPRRARNAQPRRGGPARAQQSHEGSSPNACAAEHSRPTNTPRRTRAQPSGVRASAGHARPSAASAIPPTPGPPHRGSRLDRELRWRWRHRVRTTRWQQTAGWTGLEPAASGVTGRRYNRLNYHPSHGSHEAAPSPAPRSRGPN